MLSLADVCFSTVKAAVGLGLLFLPSQLAKTGYLGLSVIVLFGVLTGLSLHACSRSTQRTGCYDYYGLAEQTLGMLGKTAVFAIFFVYIGGCCLIYFSTMVLYLLSLFPAMLSESFSTLLVFAAVLLLSLVKNTKTIARIAAAGFVGILYTISIVVLDAWSSREDIARQESGPAKLSLVSFCTFFSSVGFSYSNQFAYMAGIRDMKRPSDKRRAHAIIISSIAETAVYVLFAAVGYYLFGERLAQYQPADVLSIGTNSAQIDGKTQAVSSPHLMLLYQIATGMMFFSILFTFPLFLTPLRDMVLRCIPPLLEKTALSAVASLLFCLFFAAASLLLDINKIDSMLKYVSGFAGSFLFFFLPAAFFFQTEHPFVSQCPKDIAVFFLLAVAAVLSLCAFLVTLFE